MNLKPKTINYLHNSASKADALLALAIKYRTAFNSAKTSAARDYYKKKLTKTVDKLQPLMSMFSELEQIKKEREQELEPVAEVAPEIAE